MASKTDDVAFSNVVAFLTFYYGWFFVVNIFKIPFSDYSLFHSFHSLVGANCECLMLNVVAEMNPLSNGRKIRDCVSVVDVYSIAALWIDYGQISIHSLTKLLQLDINYWLYCSFRVVSNVIWSLSHWLLPSINLVSFEKYAALCGNTMGGYTSSTELLFSIVVTCTIDDYKISVRITT